MIDNDVLDHARALKAYCKGNKMCYECPLYPHERCMIIGVPESWNIPESEADHEQTTET